MNLIFERKMEYYTKVAIDCHCVYCENHMDRPTDCDVNSYKITGNLFVITKYCHEEPFYEIHLSDNGVYCDDQCNCDNGLDPLIYHFKICKTSYIVSVYPGVSCEYEFDNVINKLLSILHKYFVVDGKCSMSRFDYDNYLLEALQ